MHRGIWNRGGVFGGRFGWPYMPMPIGEGFYHPPMYYRFNRFMPWRRRFW